MIEKKLTLVLGAGASAPYGLPSGEDLVIDVVENLDPYPDDDEERNWYPEFTHHYGFDEREVKNFRRELTNSGRQSVDRFLEHRPEYLDLGKAAIAKSLLEREDEWALVGVGDDRQGWYPYFFRWMNTDFERWSDNALSIVTFNYDRSLEKFLSQALRSSYGEDQDSVAAQLERIPIVHVHGSLGSLPWQGGDFIGYNAKADQENVEKAAQNIQLVPETGPDHDRFDRAVQLLKGAERIVFLGFGYHDENLRRLQIDKDATTRKATKVTGSSYGMGAAQITYVRNKWEIEVTHESNQKCLEFLENQVVPY